MRWKMTWRPVVQETTKGGHQGGAGGQGEASGVGDQGRDGDNHSGAYGA